MKAPGQNPQEAAQAAKSFIANQEKAAKRPDGKVSLWNVGLAIHTATDGTSPAHVDADGNPRDWAGIPTSLDEAHAIEQHEAEEAHPTDSQMDAAVDAARQVYRNVFGDSAADAAFMRRMGSRDDVRGGPNCIDERCRQ